MNGRLEINSEGHLGVSRGGGKEDQASINLLNNQITVFIIIFNLIALNLIQ